MCYSQGNAQKWSIGNRLFGDKFKKIDPLSHAAVEGTDQLMTSMFDVNSETRKTEARTKVRDDLIARNTAAAYSPQPRRQQSNTLLTGASIGQGATNSNGLSLLG